MKPLESKAQVEAVLLCILYSCVNVHALMHARCMSQPRANGVIGRLVKTGWLWREHLVDQLFVFRFTSAACRQLTLPLNRARRMDLQSATSILPILSDCACRRKDCFTTEELLASDMAALADLSGWYVEDERAETVRLVVDFGKDPRRLAYKLRVIGRELARVLPDQVMARRLGIRLLIPHELKESAIQKALVTTPLPDRVTLEVAASPILEKLLLKRKS